MAPSGEINFFSENIPFVLRGKNKLRDWFHICAKREKQNIGMLNFIFCSDKFLRKMNKEYLAHDYFTDVITFPTLDDGRINGDIYISIDRVRENAKSYGIRMYDELHRVMIHGVLHLFGYDDKFLKEVKEMRSAETRYLRIIDQSGR
jgi:rRNA maturation RNase YbeY